LDYTPSVNLRTNTDSSVTYTGPSGLTGVFTIKTGSTTAYDAPKGFTVDLTKTSSGWTLKDHQSQSTQEFNTAGDLAARKDRDNNTTQVTDTGAGAAFRNLDIVAPAGLTTSRTIAVATDTNGDTMMTQTTSAEARQVRFTRNGGNMTAFADALGRVTTFGYDAAARLTSISAPGNVGTTFGYDSSGRVSAISQLETAGGGPGTSVTRLAYISATETQLADPNTDQTQTVTAVPHTTYTLNSTKRVEGVKDAEGRPRGNTYTANFDVASTSEGLTGTESTTTNTYGANSGESLTRSASNLGLEATTSYTNPTGPAQYQPSGGKDAGGTSATYAYNGTGNQLSSTDADGAAAKVDYNPDGTVAWAASPEDETNKTFYSYTNAQLSQVTAKTGSGLGTKNLTYDTYGRTKTATNGRGITATYSYDKVDRTTGTTFSDGTAVTYESDPAGRNDRRADNAGTTLYGYDQLGRMVSRSNSAGGGTFTYTYNKASWLVTSTSPAGGTISYVYDKAGKPSSITYPYQGGTKKMVFYVDNQGRRTEAFLGSSDDQTTWVAHYRYVYNSNNKVIQVVGEQGSGSGSNTDVIDTTYCYKVKAANVTGGLTPGNSCNVNDSIPQLSKLQWKKDNLTGVITEYQYTKAGQLDWAKVSGNSTTTDFDYSYDKNGSRTNADNLSSPDVALTFNSENQISTTGYTYDTAGNLTARPGLSNITYTAGDQMKTVTKAGTTYAYTHAGTDNNELLQQTTPQGTYSYAYGRPSAQGVPTLESVTKDGQTADVLTDPSTGQPLMLRTSDGMQSMYIYDGTPGSPIALITSSAYRGFAYEYDPYGLPTLTANSGGLGVDQNPYLFAGGIQDRTTDWVHYGNRYYDPATGAWTQMDTLDSPLDPGNANRYAYAGGDPINNIDPTGMYNSRGCIRDIGLSVGEGLIGGAIAGAFAAGVGAVPGATVAGLAGAGVGAFICGYNYATS